MSRMNRTNWQVYATLREIRGKAAAEEYRHKVILNEISRAADLMRGMYK